MAFLLDHVLETRARKTHGCQGYDSSVDICSGSRTDKIQMSINVAQAQLCFDNSGHFKCSFFREASRNNGGQMR